MSRFCQKSSRAWWCHWKHLIPTTFDWRKSYVLSIFRHKITQVIKKNRKKGAHVDIHLERVRGFFLLAKFNLMVRKPTDEAHSIAHVIHSHKGYILRIGVRIQLTAWIHFANVSFLYHYICLTMNSLNRPAWI